MGLVHIYTGNGKGKTTAALGLGIRAYGRGFKVLMIQFLKGCETGELTTIKELGENIQIIRGKDVIKFTWNMNEQELNNLKVETLKLFQEAKMRIENEKIDLLILDEILGAISSGLIPLDDVCDFILNKPVDLEVALTGRNAPIELINISDYVSEINAIKHPMEKGITARIGIES